MQQKYLPNALAMGLVLGLYSIAPCCLCPAVLLLLESVRFLWCRGCCPARAKILLLLTAGHISGAWKSRRALSLLLAVSESCNVVLASWDWGRTSLLRRETACFTAWCHLAQWLVDWDHLLRVRAGPCGSYHLLITSLVSYSCFFIVWSHGQSGYKSAKGCGISTRLLWGPGQSHLRIRPPELRVYLLQEMRERWRHKSDSRLKAKTLFPWDASFFNCTALFWPFQLYNMGIKAKGYFTCTSVHLDVKGLKLTGEWASELDVFFHSWRNLSKLLISKAASSGSIGFSSVPWNLKSEFPELYFQRKVSIGRCSLPADLDLWPFLTRSRLPRHSDAPQNW